MKKNIIIISILIIILIVIGYTIKNRSAAPSVPAENPFSASVHYVCNEGKTVDADLTEKTAKLTLSDGRTPTLDRTVSADGIRYANDDDTFVFWSKGNGALVLENNEEKSYIGCISVKEDTGGLDKVYHNGSNGFNLRYPNTYTVDEGYRYEALGHGKKIWGIKFTIPASMTEGTNLSKDTYISVESIPQIQECSASLFVSTGAKVSTTTEDGTTYSIAAATDAAAGNRYEETVYALPGTNPCMAIRYFIHYGAIGNYPKGKVKEFDKDALVKQFDAIRQSLTIVQ